MEIILHFIYKNRKYPESLDLGAAQILQIMKMKNYTNNEMGS